MAEQGNDMLALALGQMLLEYSGSLDVSALIERTKSRAEKCLLDILEILNQEDLSDFDCVEEIVTRLGAEGLRTFRHDFG